MVIDRLRLDEKVALVVGGGRGLGKGMAEALAQAGADVAIAARTWDQLESTAEELEKFGIRALPVTVEMQSLRTIQEMVDKVVNHYGQLDILVNASGMNIRKPVTEVNESDWEQLMAVNLKGPFFCCQAAAKVMIEQGKGKIINTASLTSELGFPNMSMYGISKGGISQMTKAMAVEWAPFKINVNAVGPGYYRTQMTAPLFNNPDKLQGLLDRIPQNRTGLPQDLAGAVILLASQAGDYITGQTIYVDGGWLAG
ncbi:glucose 1-dehydrogenase [Metallumcola ferriviriculae]|uniref:Glucose 1-dehydrogenase n=1 Tax=Metallumcola ferriviriculae TaxID=3039180 RepID=A0AAU0USK2_9FIRM|nr:glucose 1-dehydrogenase [Desulfitibacteraceae bacterium MK1]